MQSADRIIVIEEGRVVEAGSHRDLLDLDGRYAALQRAQRGSTAAVAQPVGA